LYMEADFRTCSHTQEAGSSCVWGSGFVSAVRFRLHFRFISLMSVCVTYVVGWPPNQLLNGCWLLGEHE
jgi:hypothetical protein